VAGSAGIFQAAEKSREIEVRIPAGMMVRPGDTIELTIGPKFLLRAAMLAYGLPLAGVVLFPGLAWLTTGNIADNVGIVLAVAGLVAGLILGRQILQRESVCEQFVPAIRTGPGDGTA
jgi:positive regulator of sigma E activity